MADVQGRSFRATSGYVTDPADTSPEISEAVNYPTTSPEGFSVGWVTEGETLNAENDSTSGDARTAGAHWSVNSGDNVYGIDVTAGEIDLEIAIGERGFRHAGSFVIYDDTTLVATIYSGDVGGNGRYADANATVHTSAANWAANQTAKRFDITSGKVRIHSSEDTFSIDGCLSGHIKVTTVGSSAQTLTPSLFANQNTFYAATITVEGGTQTLTPSLFANQNTFYAATVTPGAVTLTPSLFANQNTFYAPTLLSTYDLTPSLFANQNTFYAATVTAGAVELTPSLFENQNTFYSATITVEGGTQTLTPSLFENQNTFYGATVTGGDSAVSLPGFNIVSSGGARGPWALEEKCKKKKRKRVRRKIRWEHPVEDCEVISERTIYPPAMLGRTEPAAPDFEFDAAMRQGLKATQILGEIDRLRPQVYDAIHIVTTRNYTELEVIDTDEEDIAAILRLL